MARSVSLSNSTSVALSGANSWTTGSPDADALMQTMGALMIGDIA
jgi:hypothetical protein